MISPYSTPHSLHIGEENRIKVRNEFIQGLLTIGHICIPHIDTDPNKGIVLTSAKDICPQQMEFLHQSAG